MTDGVNTTAVVTGPFEVPFKNPNAQIMPLLTEALFTTGEPVVLYAFASDPEQGALEGNFFFQYWRVNDTSRSLSRVLYLKLGGSIRLTAQYG